MGEGALAVRRALSGIRLRVVLGYLALLAAALVIAVVLARQLLLTELDRRIEDDLTQEAEELRALAQGNDPETGEPFGPGAEAIFDTFLSRNVPNSGEAFFTLVDGRPHRYSVDPPAQLLDDDALVARWADLEGPERDRFETAAGQTRTLAVPLRSSEGVEGVFVVAAFPQEDLEELAGVVRALVVASAVLLALAASVAWGLAGRVLRPARELGRTAQRITGSDLSARIPVEGHDELADLGHAFNAMVDRVESGMREQRAFLDAVAHELRTPLTIVRGHLEVLGDDPAERRETVALVMEELDRMSRYVSDLLVLARAGEPDFLRRGPVDLGELVGSLMQKVSALGDRRWVVDAAPREGMVALDADGDRLAQALLSLADNAVQHTGPGDEIGLGALVEDGHARLWVRDTGEGLDPALAGAVFDRRVRGERARASRPGGLGIGLSIVASIARAHGGRADVASEPGAGATFSLTIPLEPPEEAA